jgi:hypothetical protein
VFPSVNVCASSELIVMTSGLHYMPLHDRDINMMGKNVDITRNRSDVPTQVDIRDGA